MLKLNVKANEVELDCDGSLVDIATDLVVATRCIYLQMKQSSKSEAQCFKDMMQALFIKGTPFASCSKMDELILSELKEQYDKRIAELEAKIEELKYGNQH